MKVGIKLVKVKKFGIGWCIPHRMAADKAEGGSGQTPPAWNRVKLPTKGQLISKCPYEKSVLSKIPTKKFPRFLS